MPDTFRATSRYGGPVEASVGDDREGVGLSVGEDYDDYGYTVLSWVDAEHLRDWLTTALDAPRDAAVEARATRSAAGVSSREHKPA